GAVVNRNEMMNRKLTESTFTPSRTYIILDSDQDAVNGENYKNSRVYNNLPDDASNNHGGAGLYVSFLDSHTRFVSRDDWIETTAFAGKLGAINYNQMRLYDPRIRRQGRPDSGPGYLWTFQ
ncbi:MAG: hypothetical protein MI741_19270, partial [Rhodospirillales bacterium]|nr:hypothetical protein [Rhodospirillales bacterium]